MGWYISTIPLVLLVPLVVITVDVVQQIIRHRIERKGHPLPPGPVPFPILGNTVSIDNRRPWLTYTKWRATYGDIMYVRLLNSDVIVLNSASVAMELLEKRSRLYSDRPFIPTLAPYGCDCNFALLPYGEHWKLCRRIIQQTFRAESALNFRPVQLRRARELVYNIIDNSKEYPFHFSTFTAAVAMCALYDYEPSPRNDPMVSIINNYIQTALPGLAPGKMLLLRMFPFLPYIPDWLPGSWITRQSKEALAWKHKMIEMPYQYVQKRMESKDDMNVAMVADHIALMEKFTGSYRSQYETALKDASATAFIGSVETINSSLMTFMLAMVENPQVWKKAQAVADAVVGTDRLPEFDDRSNMPFIEAVLRETLRYRPVAPMLLPRFVTSSDVYEGYYIPKGATLLVNAWAISRDETRYPDAEKFDPGRYLDAEGKLTDDNPGDFVFGYGRRACPGRNAAEATLWSAIATMLATLDFNLAKDADGNDIKFRATFTSGVTDHPDPFPCQITPRAHVGKEVMDRVLRK